MARVCIFGDSITWGSADLELGGWVGRIRNLSYERLDLSDPNMGSYTAIYNCGVSGDTLADLLARIEPEAKARRPAVLVIAIGINDACYEDHPLTPLDEFERDYESLINVALGLCKEVIIVTPTNVDETNHRLYCSNDNISAIIEIIKRISKRHNIRVVDVFGLLNEDDPAGDGIHPEPSGHQKLSEAIAPIIFASPALSW